MIIIDDMKINYDLGPETYHQYESRFFDIKLKIENKKEYDTEIVNEIIKKLEEHKHFDNDYLDLLDKIREKITKPDKTSGSM